LRQSSFQRVKNWSSAASSSVRGSRRLRATKNSPLAARRASSLAGRTRTTGLVAASGAGTLFAARPGAASGRGDSSKAASGGDRGGTAVARRAPSRRREETVQSHAGKVALFSEGRSDFLDAVDRREQELE